MRSMTLIPYKGLNRPWHRTRGAPNPEGSYGVEDVTNIHLPEEGEGAEETKKMVEAEGAKCITLGLDLSFGPLVSAFRS